MKNLTKKIKKIDKSFLRDFFEYLIEHNFFKPVVISILTSFILINGFDYVHSFFQDYQYYRLKKIQNTPVRINVSSSKLNFDFDEEQILEYRVKRGDTLTQILLDVGAQEVDVVNILTELKKVYNPRGIGKNDQITIKYRVKLDVNQKESSENISKSVTINSVSLASSVDKEILILRSNSGSYQAKEVKISLTRHVSRYYGTLKNGFFVDGVQAGISPTAMMNMIQLYSYDVDFQRDIKSGDKFEMLVESYYNEEGKKVKDGDVLFSSLTLQKSKSIDFYLHKVDGRIEYFDAKGNSIRKSLLRTPINGARVSSGFGLRRHPILGYSKMHQGVDFAAASGTPILAAGSGKITYYSKKGGYGNFVQIRHNQDYSTAYGHASRFVKKLRVGSSIKQGEVVAYVGSTGRSTGPHLHFEVIYKGKPINPSKVKATSGLRLSGKELIRFNADKAEIDKYRKNIPNQIRK